MSDTKMKVLVDTLFTQVHEWIAPAFKAIEARIARAERVAETDRTELKALANRQAQQISSMNKQISALERKVQ